jgi:hypothetical protein
MLSESKLLEMVANPPLGLTYMLGYLYRFHSLQQLRTTAKLSR